MSLKPEIKIRNIKKRRKTMRHFIKTILICAFFCSAVLSFGQNLLANPDYQKALELQKLAQNAFAQGDYDKAYEYSAQAETYANKARETTDRERLKYRADSLIKYLDGRFQSADIKKLEAQNQADVMSAKKKYENAKTEYAAEDYQKSYDDAQSAKQDLDRLDSSLGITSPTPSPTPTTTPKSVVLPRYFVVRLIPANRDCFWNIAALPFIYNDPMKWGIIYNANKNILPIPANADLILPNQVLEIPAIAGETREGTYDPARTYPTLPAGQ
jgi:nucleoid-associated protein YgaU